MPLKFAQNYSGVVVNQNQIVDENVLPAAHADYTQEFHLPSDYRRGTESGELRYPAISGLQFMAFITEGCSRYVAFDYELQYQVFSLGWITAVSGVAIGAPSDDQAWITAHFETPVEIDADKASARWRIVFGAPGRPDGTGGELRDVIVTYANGQANVLGTLIEAELQAGNPYHFTYNGNPAFLYLDPLDSLVYFSYEQGLTFFVITEPNPFVLPHFDQAYDYDSTPLNGAFIFRVLGLTAENGVDFLGNEYRSVVDIKSANEASTALGADPDSYWLSKPNPSKFAIENLYFDVRKPGPTIYDPDTLEPIELDPADTSTVTDRILIDPITPGAYFNVYYTQEGGPASTDEGWENKLWTRVPQTYRMERRETHVLPEPIQAKYIKIEFSHLQAQHYAPGDFQQPIRYKKHPKWVLDFFLVRLQSNNFLAERVSVINDALTLAYDYYLDDLGQEPESSIDADSSVASSVSTFLRDNNDVSDRIDPLTLDKINLALAPYRDHPALRGTPETLLGQFAQASIDPNQDYSVEATRKAGVPTSDVSSLNRDRVVVEQNYPVMFFYLTCRHKYREIEAKLTHNRAYFAGVRQIAFLRDNYMTAFDTDTYIEPAADTQNIERNEFI